MLRTGCFRDEYILRDGGAKQIQLPKSYVEVFLDGDRHRHAGLVEIEGPPPPEGHLPSSVLDFGPVLKQLLAEQEGHDEANAQLRAHEANEDTEAD